MNTNMDEIIDKLIKLKQLLDYAYKTEHTRNVELKIEKIIEKIKDKLVRKLLILKAQYLINDENIDEHKIQLIDNIIEKLKDLFENPKKTGPKGLQIALESVIRMLEELKNKSLSYEMDL